MLDLFNQPSLKQIKCDMYAIDSSIMALSKQKVLINTYGLNGSSHTIYQANLYDPATFNDFLKQNGPFDFIFSANVLSELKPEYIDNILGIVQKYLDPNGIYISVESQNTPAKRACPYLSHNAKNEGLFTFYPCPPDNTCVNSECWNWFVYNFVCNDVNYLGEVFPVTKTHTLIPRIFTKQPLSIYQHFNAKSSEANWGIVHPHGSIYELCTETGQFIANINRRLGFWDTPDPWSHIIGFSNWNALIDYKWSIIDDFSSCDSKIEKK